MRWRGKNPPLPVQQAAKFMYKNYLETEIENANPLQLVRLLYRGALEATAAARVHLAAGDIGGRSRSITKAHAILTELTRSLNHEAGGQISRNLRELYDYTQRRLLTANMEQQDAPLAEVEGLLRELQEAWNDCRLDPASERSPVDAYNSPLYQTQDTGAFATESHTLSFTY